MSHNVRCLVSCERERLHSMPRQVCTEHCGSQEHQNPVGVATNKQHLSENMKFLQKLIYGYRSTNFEWYSLPCLEPSTCQHATEQRAEYIRMH